jgi:hypothetical protein
MLADLVRRQYSLLGVALQSERREESFDAVAKEYVAS